MAKKAKRSDAPPNPDAAPKVVVEWDDVQGEVGNEEIPELMEKYRANQAEASAAEATKKLLQPHLMAALMVAGVGTIKTAKHQVTWVKTFRDVLNMEKVALKLAEHGLQLSILDDCYDKVVYQEYPLVSDRVD